MEKNFVDLTIRKQLFFGVIKGLLNKGCWRKVEISKDTNIEK